MDTFKKKKNCIAIFQIVTSAIADCMYGVSERDCFQMGLRYKYTHLT